jgi:hypothetical protein
MSTSSPSPRAISTAIILKVLKSVLVPIVVSLTVTLFSTDLVGQTQITDSAAHSFLTSYYTQVVKPDMRRYLFRNKLTESFRTFPGHDWNSYEHWWRTQESVTVGSVLPVQGNASEFTVSLTYESKRTHEMSLSTMSMWLVCDGNYFTGRLPGMGCSADNLQIDNTQYTQAGN